jgi:hypothetical protein
MSRVVLVDRLDTNPTELPERMATVSTADEVVGAASSKDGVWVALSEEDVEWLLPVLPPVAIDGQHRLLALEAISTEWVALLQPSFRWLVSANRETSFLPREELLEALAAPNRRDLFVAVTNSSHVPWVVLHRGTLEPLVVPRDYCGGSKTTGSEGSTAIQIVDYGHGVRYGGREASTDAILYAFDPEYRRRRKANMIEQDETFGGSLRRLRRLRGLSRSDFDGVSAKEVARIERGEVTHPHGATLSRLAARLGVEPGEIASY